MIVEASFPGATRVQAPANDPTVEVAPPPTGPAEGN